ncbi:MAG: hypothetical protein Kow0074_16670 [Candidatus Zixiibacteriota bacterium]
MPTITALSPQEQRPGRFRVEIDLSGCHGPSGPCVRESTIVTDSQETIRKKVRHFNDPGHAHFLTFSCHGRLDLLDDIGYIHNNPVRKRLVESTTDWRWSSARYWAGMGETDLKMDAIA